MLLFCVVLVVGRYAMNGPAADSDNKEQFSDFSKGKLKFDARLVRHMAMYAIAAN